MAQHSGQQANNLPTLLVHPKSVFLIVYPGGHCGEFLAWWLGLHPGCVRTQIKSVDNNRFVWQSSYQFEYSEEGTQDRVFLTSHLGSTISKAGFDVADTSQHVRLYSSKKYLHFFYYLFLIKTIFFKYWINEPRPPAFFNNEQWTEFLKYLGDRDSFYYYEAENWLTGRDISMRDYLQERWGRLKNADAPDVEPSVDVGKLFFEDTEHQVRQLLSNLNITFSPKLFYDLAEYHQRNIEVVEKYSKMKIDQFLDLSPDSALEVITQSFS